MSVSSVEGNTNRIQAIESDANRQRALGDILYSQLNADLKAKVDAATDEYNKKDAERSSSSSASSSSTPANLSSSNSAAGNSAVSNQQDENNNLAPAIPREASNKIARTPGFTTHYSPAEKNSEIIEFSANDNLGANTSITIDGETVVLPNLNNVVVFADQSLDVIARTKRHLSEKTGHLTKSPADPVLLIQVQAASSQLHTLVGLFSGLVKKRSETADMVIRAVN